MKRLLIITLLMLVLVGCTEKRDAKIPIENPSYIAVYNSGAIIYEASVEDGFITVSADKIKTITVSWSDTSEYWLVYYITQNGITTKIVDSDTLSIVWRN